MVNVKNPPLFVKVDEYEDVVSVVNLIQKNIADIKVILDRVAELKAQEDAEFESWKSELAVVEDKIQTMNDIIFEPLK